ncbi:MAG: hypothetical protein RIF32_16515 [Leptospirales bacterium]|jgi:hypothetical protein
MRSRCLRRIRLNQNASGEGGGHRPARAATLLLACMVTCALFAPDAGLFGRDRSLFFRTPDYHFIQQLDEHSSVDWTGGYVFARSRVRLPRIVYDPSHSDFGGPGTATSISDARATARNKATELASLRLMNSVTSLRLDSRFTLLEKMRADSALRESLGSLASRFITKSRNTGEGYVSVELAMPFLGRDGLYGMLGRSYYGTQRPPEVSSVDVPDHISGLVVDLREYPEFRPSLEPRIFTDRGRLIFGPEMAGRTCLRLGLVAYYASSEQARRDRRVGGQPYYTYAAGVLGAGRSDIYLDAEDAERILGHRSGRVALSRCSVVFVLKQSAE